MVHIKSRKYAFTLIIMKPSIEAYRKKMIIIHSKEETSIVEVNKHKQDTTSLMKELSKHSKDCSLMVDVK